MDKLLTKISTTKLTRKEFLIYLGALILGISGISSLLKSVSEINMNSNIIRSDKSVTNINPRGFGSGPYGV